MDKITVNGFLGANLAFDELLLPANVGVQSLNQRPGFGDLRPWNDPGAPVEALPASPQRLTMYRMNQDVASEDDYWLGWSAIVHAVRGFENEDTAERTYYSGDGTPKWTDTTLALGGGPPYPQAWRELGVPAPTTALVATVNTAAVSGTDQAFSWVYTFVNDLGWESRPSEVSNILVAKPGTTFDLAGFDTAPAGAYGITSIRLYRFVPGSGTSGSYFLLREFVIGSTPANPVDDARAVGSAEVATTGWRPPPSDGHSLTKLWNGMMALASGKSVYISEPYKHYAWPLAYLLEFPVKVIGMAVWGQQLLVLTTGDAYVVTGSTPAGLDDEPTKINQPCTSVRGIVEFNEGDGARGVVWPSESGLCWYGDGGYRNLLEGVLTREQWQTLAPSTMVAGRHRGLYVCFYNDGALKGFVIDPRNPQGIYFLSVGYRAVFRDPISDRLYVLDGANVRRWDAGSAMTTTFRSKVYQTPVPIKIGAVEVIAKSYPVAVKMWADGTLRLDRSVSSQNPVRPTGNWMADRFQFEIATSGRVLSLRAAVSVDDLRTP